MRNHVLLWCCENFPQDSKLRFVSTLGVQCEYCNRHCLLRIQERRITAEPESMRKRSSVVEYGWSR
ncbi:hypothetical protein CY34DRAFT_805492 [Suillus luteus UH-Slu-Lm8-n1]|uniref:Uncharacterized protein n=1 Tax=Suillus luteus UH-Slu-Lm8-n1 TaxID=930992 RepID=A0A0D0AJB1_9AGAM|nr:hypothetical protein CY34DRAFT_805492 [Suillus luteus UH-Slu-Lm8-n1]